MLGIKPCTCEIDADGDGHYALRCGGDDCREDAYGIWRGTGEQGDLCSNQIDDDCDVQLPGGGIDCGDLECFSAPHYNPSPTPTPSGGGGDGDGYHINSYCINDFFVVQTYYCLHGNCILVNEEWHFDPSGCFPILSKEAKKL